MSSPAARSISASIATSNVGGGRGAAGRKTEAGPRAGRTSRPRPSVVPGHGADRSLPRGRMPPTHYRPPHVRRPECLSKQLVVPLRTYFLLQAVHGTCWASLLQFAWIERVGAEVWRVTHRTP